jgi:MFS family permease
MLARFSLYGFLKNQRYFEPFLVLAFLEKGLSFFDIGLLISFRELAVIAFEIPSGAMADVYGRRKSMVLSFVAYIASFLVFGLSRQMAPLFLAMFLFAIGEAFRTGTHKAMIFAWLRAQGQIGERTRYYGYTRSWSKFGSALSVVLAGVFVFVSDSYTTVFYLAVIPYVLGIINFAGYPKDLDEAEDGHASMGKVWRRLTRTLAAALKVRDVRRLVMESMGYEGVFHAVKDYIQPVLTAAATVMTARLFVEADLSEPQRAVFLVVPVYLVLYLLSGLASRRAHTVAVALGGEDRAARVVWGGSLVVFVSLALTAFYDLLAMVIGAFVLLHVVQNIWRPILISRFDSHGGELQGATLLSVESQSRRVATMVAAPAIGLAVDAVAAGGPGGPFWPVGMLGTVVTLVFFLTALRAAEPEAGSSSRST